MTGALHLHINGKPREFAASGAPVSLEDLVRQLSLQADRIAVEHNGLIAPRTTWSSVQIAAGDRIEIVHFVGGGRV